MSYTAKDFAQELRDDLQNGYDVVRLSRWAMATYLKNACETDASLDTEIMRVVAMEEGPEFELSEDELMELAIRLMQ